MSSSTLKVHIASLAMLYTIAGPAAAQETREKMRRSPFDVPRVSLASLPEVQAELKLNDDQKKLADDLQGKLVEDRIEVFQSNSGDWEAMIEEIQKLNSDATASLLEKLDDSQKQRLTEIYVQANGPNALSDSTVIETLQITSDQQKALDTAREDNRYAFMDAWQELQGMSEEDRREAVAELQEEGDAHLLKALTEEQREQFAKLAGDELDYDLTPLLPRRGG